MTRKIKRLEKFVSKGSKPLGGFRYPKENAEVVDLLKQVDEKLSKILTTLKQ